MPISIMAQANILNAKLPEEVGKKTQAQIEQDNDAPLDYGYIDDRDILWSKTVWEVIDLDERVNFPLYYPTDTIGIGADRRSLYHVLMKNIKNGKLTEVYTDSYFTEKRKFEELSATLSKVGYYRSWIRTDQRRGADFCGIYKPKRFECCRC